MNPCLRCGKRREHAFHDPRARVYAEDRHEYEGAPCTYVFDDGEVCGGEPDDCLHDTWLRDAGVSMTSAHAYLPPAVTA